MYVNSEVLGEKITATPILW